MVAYDGHRKAKGCLFLQNLPIERVGACVCARAVETTTFTSDDAQKKATASTVSKAPTMHLPRRRDANSKVEGDERG